MVTHDAVAASYADRAIVFADGGRIVADEANPTAETMNEPFAPNANAPRALPSPAHAPTRSPVLPV